MFGYVTIHRPELKIKDEQCYRAFYCGLCRSLRDRYGRSGQTTLSYDMTFLAMLLSALYEPETQEGTTLCLLHPSEKHATRANRFVDYAGDMNLLLAYYNRLDDWKDDKKLSAKLAADAIKKKCAAVEEKYPRQAEAVKKYIEELSAIEKEDSRDLDAASGATGRMLAEVFCPEEDVWAPHLRKIGFYLGKFIYLMDAFEDFDKDLASGSYNPWKGEAESRLALADKARDVLTMMLSEGSMAFEHLPILLYEDILRNILYAGVWNAFEDAVKKDKETAEKKAGEKEAAQ